MTSAVAMKVKGVVKMASPGPTLYAMRAMSKASVPEAQATACFTPTKSASRLLEFLDFRPHDILTVPEHGLDIGFKFFSNPLLLSK